MIYIKLYNLNKKHRSKININKMDDESTKNKMFDLKFIKIA